MKLYLFYILALDYCEMKEILQKKKKERKLLDDHISINHTTTCHFFFKEKHAGLTFQAQTCMDFLILD